MTGGYMFTPLCGYSDNGRALFEYCKKEKVTFGYYYDLDALHSRLDVIDKSLAPFFRILFSLKANSAPKLLANIAARSRFGADVSSENELRAALQSGFGREDVFFVGPGKSISELQSAIELGIGSIIVESIYELGVIDRIAALVGMRPSAVLRINPTYEVRGVRMAMGGRPTQFGMNEADAIRILLNSEHLYPNIDMGGIHAYVGTRILSAKDALWNIYKVMECAENILRKGVKMSVVDIGGGLGIPYYSDEPEFDFGLFIDRLPAGLSDFPLVRQNCRIYMESGRFLTGPVGCFFAQVRETTVAGDEQHVEINATPALHALSHGGVLTRDKEFFGASLTSEGWLAGTIPTHVWYRVNGRRRKWPTKVLCGPASENDFIIFLNSGAYGPAVSPVWENLEGYPTELTGTKGDICKIGTQLGCMELANMQALVLSDK